MPENRVRRVTRRKLVQAAIAAPAVFHIVPRFVLGGPGQDRPPPSETLGGALIGVGGRGPGTFQAMSEGHAVRKLAECDVKFLDRADGKYFYTDFRRVLERKDVDVVAIATPPHWHALISIAAAQAGKDVFCEKPLTRFIAEGRAVVKAFARYGRILQVGTFGRFAASKEKDNVLTHKIMRSGLLKECPAVHVHAGGWKVKDWSGRPEQPVVPVPKNLDWDMYCGPSPLKPFVRDRIGGTHRCYWDYEGGGLSDMGQHYFDGVQWTYGKDDTSPVEIEAHAPPQHPEVTGMWGWVELKYADGLTLVFDGEEWGKPYDRKQARKLKLEDLPEAERAKILETPDPAPLLTFAEAVKTRKQAGGAPEAAHRCAALLHLANIAVRVGRRIRYDPVNERIVGDEQANRLVDVPMRAPWHL
jgi:predicted dehydrogenase